MMNKQLLIAIAFVAIVIATSTYSITEVRSQASVLQSNQGSDLGNAIQGLTQGIIGRTNEQVQNTLENAGNQALPQLQANASQYDCLVIIMHNGIVHGAMTCTPNASNALSLSSSGGGSVQSSIQRQSNDGNSATVMQNQMQGSGSSANIIPGDVP